MSKKIEIEVDREKRKRKKKAKKKKKIKKRKSKSKSTKKEITPTIVAIVMIKTSHKPKFLIKKRKIKLKVFFSKIIMKKCKYKSLL
jgi:hypothetical protein